MNKRYLGIAISTFIMCFFLLLLGPLDHFYHGFYEEEVDINLIPDEERIGLAQVTDPTCEITFSPQKSHFAGFEIFLTSQNPEIGGTLRATITNSKGKVVDTESIDLGEVYDSTWYKVFTKAKLKQGKKYTLTFDVAEGANIPTFIQVSEDYLQKEYIKGNALVSFAYSEPTFSFQDKVIISLAVIALWLFVVSLFMNKELIKKYMRVVSCFLILSCSLTWIYMYNSIDSKNTSFDGYQVDSEGLVSGMIASDRDGVHFIDKTKSGYGLGWYYDYLGRVDNYEREFLTDDSWYKGYHRTEHMIVINTNVYTATIANPGNYIRFENGEECQIVNSTDDGNNILITLQSDRLLSYLRNGDLSKAVFLDANHNEIPKGFLVAYESQYGLHGKIFKRIARHLDEEDAITNLHLICALLTAMVFALVVILIAKKYNYLLAACFFATFLLSPWVTNFARNLYWVEFTWFAPMAVGLICLLKLESKKWRIGCYIAAFLTITIKCLCGYEYISVIMMGLISFMLVEFFNALIKKDSELSKLLFKTILIIGIAALLGFIAAILIHAPIKGDGSIIAGIKNIIKEDVLRRTSGTNLNDFESENWPAMNASVWETYSRYFHFSTQVITGIDGNLFAALCIIPLGIFGYDYRMKNEINYRQIFMYIVFFLTSISWFCLAKNHSYIHVHMNYVLWYFGFVQVCLYIIINRIVKFKSNLGE
ncbi:hypothetical protein SAMN02910377_00901 [Pseudobutyrivibrio ruminis]|uniref:Uncharacterized protein n=1 Tax=Pseudobutyrivibrio ruminis TaxID=46206 RepID=A0A1H7H2X1_9FIRM|nr:hypothetical protein [Pseudobutyrivibrio ruminis]SEK44649.1 hypothetical protein SAMN02910377_00901 [Pseudobutyrivibrio ruminis]